MSFHARSRAGWMAAGLVGSVLAGASSSLLGSCGLFTDVAADAFCPFVVEIFTLGITSGTSATTYDPAGNITRLQMAAFLSRTVDGVLKRGSRRAALQRFWNTDQIWFGKTIIDPSPFLLASDGQDVWVACTGGTGTVVRVRGGDSKILETWTGAFKAVGVVAANGDIFVTGEQSPDGHLYRIRPSTDVAGAVTTIATNLGGNPLGISFDGGSLLTANASGSVSIVGLTGVETYTVTTVTAGFSGPNGVVFDGQHTWVTDTSAGTLLKLVSPAAILQTVTVGTAPEYPAFDGANIWVPNYGSNSVTVVRASTGAVLATLTGNDLNGPKSVAFDGERIVVTNQLGGNLSMWKAADLTPILATGHLMVAPYGACSDGVNFWVTDAGAQRLLRF